MSDRCYEQGCQRQGVLRICVQCVQKLEEERDTAVSRGEQLQRHWQQATKIFDMIAEICGCAQWEYTGQIIRDVQALRARADLLALAVAHCPAPDCACQVIDILDKEHPGWRPPERAHCPATQTCHRAATERSKASEYWSLYQEEEVRRIKAEQKLHQAKDEAFKEAARWLRDHAEDGLDWNRAAHAMLKALDS